LKAPVAFYCCIFFTLFTFSTQRTCAWGFYGHQLINRKAVFTLPAEMLMFYKSNINFLSAHAVDADKRRYINEDEAPKHYIDMEYYLRFNQRCLIDSIPYRYQDAVSFYSLDSMRAWGILPWATEQTFYRLLESFKAQDKEKILRYSADLGHYLADMQVPLHTTENHNGQLTGQHGIHALWESRVPEISAVSYDFLVGQAVYISSIKGYFWESIWLSHGQKDEVLKQEKRLTASMAADKKYTLKEKGKVVKKDYSEVFVLNYEKALEGMVEAKMKRSVLVTGSLWYTAWVMAGQPDLNALLEK
jgi:hypothetical protein